MASFNQATVMGNIGQEPKVSRNDKTGAVTMTAFSLATTERGYTRKDGTKVEDSTEWHNIVLFGRLAEVAAQYLHKGNGVLIQGRLRTRSYTGKDNAKHFITEIVGDTMQMLPKDTNGNNPAAADAQSTAEASISDFTPDEQARINTFRQSFINTQDDSLPF